MSRKTRSTEPRAVPETAAVPETIPESAPVQPATAEMSVRIVAAAANVHREPDPLSPVLATLKHGDVCSVALDSSGEVSGWVRLANGLGWIMILSTEPVAESE